VAGAKELVDLGDSVLKQVTDAGGGAVEE